MKQRKRLQWHRYPGKFLVWVAKYTVPYIYFAYFRLVWATSRVIDLSSPLDEALAQHPKRFVAVLWHQDVLCVPWAYRRFHGQTIASVGDAGDVIARLLELCNFTVFRGGSSKRDSRRVAVLDEFIEHVSGVDRPAVGITVDGSSGPNYRMKRGAIVMAMRIGAPLYVVRIWSKRRFLLPTWDRTLLPLPFSKIVILAEGPYWPPDDMGQEPVFNAFHRTLEDRLLCTTHVCFQMLESPLDESLLADFPAGWKPTGFAPGAQETR